MADEEIIDEPIVEDKPDEFEADAVKYGWKPPEDFNGDGHMSAEAFMTRGPGTSRKLAEEVETLRADAATSKDTNEARWARMEATQKARFDADVNAKAEEIAGQQREAAESGDMEEYDRLAAVKPAPAEPAVDVDVKTAMDAWMPDNPWFQNDPVATNEAISMFDGLRKQGKSAAEALEVISERIEIRNPWLFPKPKEPEAKPGAPTVEGGTTIRKANGKKGWGDIPAEDRSLVERQIADGDWDAMAKQMKSTPQAAFAATYWEQE